MVKSNPFRKKAFNGDLGVETPPKEVPTQTPVKSYPIVPSSSKTDPKRCNCINIPYQHSHENPSCLYYFGADKQPPLRSLSEIKDARASAAVFQHQHDWQNQPKFQPTIVSKTEAPDNPAVGFPIRKECKCSGKGYVIHYWDDVGCLFDSTGVLKSRQTIREEAKIPWQPAPTVEEDRLVAAFNNAILARPDIFSAMLDGGSMTHSMAKRVMDELHIMGYGLSTEEMPF